MERNRVSDPKVRFLINLAYWAAIIAIILVIMKYFLNVMMPIFLAFVFASIVRPISRFLSREIKVVKNKDGEKVIVKRKFHLTKNFAGILSVVVLFIVAVGLLTVILIRIIDFGSEVVVTIPTFYEETVTPAFIDLYNRLLVFASRFDESVLEMIESAIPNLISSIGSFVTGFSGKAVSFVTGLATSVPTILLNVIICLIATVFIAIDYDMIMGFVRNNLPNKTLSMVIKVKDSFLDMLWGFLKSYFIIFCITVAEITVGLIIIGFDRPLLIAVLIGIFDAFPIVGSGMILLPWALITMIVGGLGKGMGLLILYATVVIVRQFIEPKIVGKRVGLRPIVTLTCMYAGTTIIGGLGLFALPIAASILVDLNENGIISIFKKEPDPLQEETGSSGKNKTENTDDTDNSDNAAGIGNNDSPGSTGGDAS